MTTARDHVIGLPRFRAVATLEPMRQLLAALGDPQLALRGVHVGGTNGKGSVCALLDSVLRCAGMRTALLVKPHLHRLEERIVIDGDEVSTARFDDLAHRVLGAADAAGVAMLQAEALVAMGFLAAVEADVDVVISEVGIGGLWDATATADLGIAVIVSVGLDHIDVLGATRREIAQQKAGIIRPDNDVILGAIDDDVAAVIIGAAPRARSVVRTFMPVASDSGGVLVEYDGADVELTTPLRGRHQAANLAVVAATATALTARGYPITARHLRDGVARVTWPLRLEVVTPDLVVDVAHNPDALRALASALPGIAGDRVVEVVFGVLDDKPVAAMLKELRRITDTPVFIRVPSPRSSDPAALAHAWGDGARVAPDLPSARAIAGANGALVCVCGSLVLAAAAARAAHV